MDWSGQSWNTYACSAWDPYTEQLMAEAKIKVQHKFCPLDYKNYETGVAETWLDGLTEEKLIERVSFTPKSDQFQNSPAALPEIQYITQYEELGFS